jgi:hypothetical protein
MTHGIRAAGVLVGIALASALSAQPADRGAAERGEAESSTPGPGLLSRLLAVIGWLGVA